jgi:protein arginine N-methyltransferase 1
MSYSVDDYGQMIADEVRTGAYVEALRQSVRRGAVVVDLGAGTGFFSLVACALGARRVHAIEPNDAILLLPALARENGFEDRIVVHHARGDQVDLAERADVVVGDLRGMLPLEGGHLAAIADARSRFLAQGGALIPRRDELLVAPLSAPGLREHLEAPWRDRWGVRMQSARNAVLNDWHRADVRAGESSTLLGSPLPWTTVDYRAADGDTSFRGHADLEIAREGVLDGLCVGFRAELSPGVGFDTLAGERIYGRVFLPHMQALAVEPLETVHVDLAATPTRTSYAWSWAVSVRRNGRARFECRHSTVLDGTLRLPL